MFKIGDTIEVKYNGKIGAIISVEKYNNSSRYIALIDGKKVSLYPEQIRPAILENEALNYTAKDANSLFTARLLLNPNINSLYSLNSSKIDYIPYQFRPVLKIIKSESPRILIADGVGVGKTIEAGLILKELEARFDIKSVLSMSFYKMPKMPGLPMSVSKCCLIDSYLLIMVRSLFL